MAEKRQPHLEQAPHSEQQPPRSSLPPSAALTRSLGPAHRGPLETSLQGRPSVILGETCIPDALQMRVRGLRSKEHQASGSPKDTALTSWP